MARFEELAIDKTSIMMKIASNQDLCKAVYYEDRNFKSRPDIAPQKLFYENIFPYKFVPEITADRQTFVTLSFTGFRRINNVFKSGQMFIHVFTHKELFRTDYGVLRTDYIISEVDKIFNSERGSWLGDLEFISMDETYINANFHGSTIGYRVVNFQ